jgi:hypothetical protein
VTGIDEQHRDRCCHELEELLAAHRELQVDYATFGRGVGHNYLHPPAFLSLPHEQVRYVRPCSHLQPLRDPFQAHRALLAQAHANLHLLRIALAATHQVVLGQIPPSQFGSDELLGARFVRLAQLDPVN